MLVHHLGATTINSLNYSYDKVDNRKSKTNPGGAHNSTYDTLNRLVDAPNLLPSNPRESYVYDLAGNRATANQNGLSIFKPANHLVDDASFTAPLRLTAGSPQNPGFNSGTRNVELIFVPGRAARSQTLRRE